MPPMSVAPEPQSTGESFEPLEETYEVMPPVERGPATVWRPEPQVERERTCPKCGYDLRGITSERCPECGETYREAVLDRNDKAVTYAWLFSFRWVLFGVLPMFIWAVLAWFMLRFGGTYGYIAAFSSGIVAALGLAMWSAAQAFEEHDELEGLVLAVAVMLAVGFLNFSTLQVLLSL